MLPQIRELHYETVSKTQLADAISPTRIRLVRRKALTALIAVTKIQNLQLKKVNKHVL